MAMNANETPEFPLTREQIGIVENLVDTLDRERLYWVSGYLAGKASQVTGAGPQAAAPGAVRLTVLYGSETGNAENLAESVTRKAIENGMAARVLDMADYPMRELRDERLLMIIAATHGEGAPAEPAAGFYEFLHGRKAPKLPSLNFAVLSLGDSSYEHFCQAGRDFDARLEDLGATRLRERLDCDIDFAASAQTWIDDALRAFGEKAGTSDNLTEATVLAFERPVPKGEFGRHRPFSAEVLENLQLNGRGSQRETRHIEFSLEGSGIAYTPGDVLGLIAPNSSVVVDAFIDALSLDPAREVTVGAAVKPLREALLHDYEVTTATPRFLRGWADSAGAQPLIELLADDAIVEQRRYLQSRWLIDIIREHPIGGFEPDDLLQLLRPLQPREYSIASSMLACPDEVHITVSAVRFEVGEERRSGVASGFIADSVAAGDRLQIFVRQNRHFRLPADPGAPIIMIGPGTGVAPFRAFMHERQVLGATGRNWLFFGSLNFRTDFLYQTEWQRWLADGLLTRLDVAFSRDQAQKLYVQHRLLERGRDIYRWLEEGAHVYICGDAAAMAPDVHAALLQILRVEGGMSNDAAGDYLSKLQSTKRYQRDTY